MLVNKIYSLNPKFISDLKNYFRKIRLSRHKKKKVNESKTDYNRLYNLKFKIHVEDQINPQVSEIYDSVVPATAAFFAKTILERNILGKIKIEIVGVEEMTEEEYEEYSESKENFVSENKNAL